MLLLRLVVVVANAVTIPPIAVSIAVGVIVVIVVSDDVTVAAVGFAAGDIVAVNVCSCYCCFC